MMKKDTVQITDRTCTIYKSEQPEYLLIQPIDEHDLEVLDNEVATIQSLTNKSFTFVAFEIKDWQSELTPWTAPAEIPDAFTQNGINHRSDFILCSPNGIVVSHSIQFAVLH